MTLTLDIQGQILNKRMSGMGFDMEWNAYESIGCWTYYVTLNFGFTHDLQIFWYYNTGDVYVMWLCQFSELFKRYITQTPQSQPWGLKKKKLPPNIPID